MPCWQLPPIVPGQMACLMQVLVPHSHDVELEDFELFSGHLALMKRVNGVSMISTFSLNASEPETALLGIASEEPKLIDFSEDSYSLEFGEQDDFNGNVLRIAYSSLVTPETTFDVHMTTGRPTALAPAVMASSGHFSGSCVGVWRCNHAAWQSRQAFPTIPGAAQALAAECRPASKLRDRKHTQGKRCRGMAAPAQPWSPRGAAKRWSWLYTMQSISGVMMLCR